MTAPGWRVLIVCRADGVGGTERTLASLIDLLGEQGMTVDLVALWPSRAGPGLLARHEPTVIPAPGRSRPVRRLRQLRWLRRAMRDGGYAAVVAFGPVPNELVSLARSRGGPRVIISERGDPFIAARRRWNRSSMWSYRRADVLVVPTDLAAAALQPIRRRPRRVEVVANPLTPGVPVVPRDRPRPRRLATVGRLVPVKRVEDLIEAFAGLGGAADGWTLQIIGDGAQRAALEALVDRRGLAGRVSFLGLHPAPWELLADVDVFVLCSEREGFSNVLLEAVASGCVVVSSDVRFGPRAMVHDGVDGVLYPVGDVDALTATLTRLLDDPARRDALARAGQEWIADHHPDAIGARWHSLVVSGGTACEVRGR